MNTGQKKVLLTGGAGFIGTNLCRYLTLQKGWHVVCADCCTYAASPESLTDLPKELFCFEKVDIRDRNEVRHLFDRHRPDGVMHLAAESHVDRSIDAAENFITTNVLGSFNLLEESRRYIETTTKPTDFRFLHVSTDEVYGSLKLGNETLFKENTSYDPRSPYSATKAASDHLVRAWGHTYGLPVVITNCSNNYGPYQYPEKLIPTVILKILQGEPIPVYGSGENIRDWLYVDDHVKALTVVYERGRSGETYNIGGGNEMSNLNLVKKICLIVEESASELPLTPVQSLISFVKDRPGHDLRYAIDASKIKRQLGWQAETNLDGGLKKTVEWYVKNQKWWQDKFTGERRGS